MNIADLYHISGCAAAVLCRQLLAQTFQHRRFNEQILIRKTVMDTASPPPPAEEFAARCKKRIATNLGGEMNSLVPSRAPRISGAQHVIVEN